jgi:O-antigen/teichoic acid export membrane protein
MIGSKTVAVAAGLFTAALINRSLGPPLRGVYAEMQTWVGLFAVLFGLSMDTAIYHFANKSLYGTDDMSRWMTTFLLSLTSGLFAMAALSIFVLGWPEQVSSETSKYLLLLDVLLIATILTGNLTIFLQAGGDIKYSAVIGVVQGVINVIVIGYAYMTDLLDIKIVLISVLIIQSITFLMLLAKFRRNNLLSGRFSKNLAKRMIAAGFKQHIATIATFVYTKINQLILFGYWGDADTGIFAVALSAAFYLMFIPMTLQTVLYPRVIHAKDDFEVTIRSLRLCFYGWGGIVLLMILLAEPILFVYGGQSFRRAVTPFRILMIAAWFLPLASLIAPYCVKIGAFYAMTTTAVILGLTSVGLNLLFIPNFSATGAALATASTCVLGFCGSLLLLGYLSKESPLEFLRLRIFG